MKMLLVFADKCQNTSRDDDEEHFIWALSQENLSSRFARMRRLICVFVVRIWQKQVL